MADTVPADPSCAHGSWWTWGAVRAMILDGCRLRKVRAFSPCHVEEECIVLFWHLRACFFPEDRTLTLSKSMSLNLGTRRQRVSASH